MLLDDALRLSSVRVAVRPEMFEPSVMPRAARKREELRLRMWEQPAVSSRNLIKFHHQTHEPVYATYVWNHQGKSIPLVLERRQPRPDWEPIDGGDTVSALGDLLDRFQVEARQRRIIERKRLLGLEEGAEWKCSCFMRLLQDPDQVAAAQKARIEAERRARRRLKKKF